MLKIIIFTFAILKHSISKIFEPRVKIADIIKFTNRLKCNKFSVKIPRQEDIKFVKMSKNIVFRKPKLTRFRFASIDTFIIAEMSDIKKYPIISANVPKYFGKKIMLNIKIEEETI